MKKIFFIFVLLFLVGCGGGGGGSDDTSYAPWNPPYIPTECSLDSEKEFVYKYMKDIYYWYDKVPDVDISNYSSLDDLLDALKYSELDKWSYISDKTTYDSYFEEGKYIGLGFMMRYDDQNNLRIALVYKNSPAYNANLQRGDIIEAINSKTIEEIEQNNLWDSIFGDREVGVEVNLSIKKLNGEEENLTLKKDIVTINSVYLSKVLNVGDKKVGYLVFLSFIEPSYDELKQAFNTFKQEGIDELILDLRYNKGGRLSIANELASLINGMYKNEVFEKFIYNDRYLNYNYTYYLDEYDESLALDRVIILTTSSTCSASESVINGLKPYIDVIIIGSTTCGKPVGMNPVEFCDKIISAVTFEGKNALNEGGYYSGFSPNCMADDNLTVTLGDENETMLKEALYYLDNDSCSSATQTTKLLIQPVKTKTIPLKGFDKEIGAF